MKAQLPLNKAKLKEFFTLHGEKVALGVFSLVFVLLVYRAYQTKNYEHVPQQMITETQQRSAMVREQTWDPAAHEIKVPNPPYAKQIEVSMRDVSPQPFLLATLFNNRIREHKIRREEPVFIAARDIRATYGFGAVRLKKEGYTGKRWIVITGLVPYAEQLAAYNERFENALLRDPKLDTPEYTDFEVERAVVRPGADPAKLVWEKVDVHAAIFGALKQFSSERPQVVERKLMEPLLCEPVPPLVDKKPDESMAHPPEIPFTIQTAEKAPDRKAEDEQVPLEDNPLKQQKDGNRPIGAPAGAAGAGAAATVAEVVPLRLVRFFDYNVESTKSYCYRVKLVLGNPNVRVARRFLKDPKLAEGETRSTDWSPASNVASVPADYRILAGELKPPAGLNEAKAKVLIVQWVPEKGVEVPHEFGERGTSEVIRGTFLNFPDTEAAIPLADKPSTTQGTVSFITNTLLVDVSGAETASYGNSKVHSPAEMLFMGVNGEMFVRNQLADHPEYAARRPQQVEAPKRRKSSDKEEEPGTPGKGPSILDLGLPPR